MSDAQRRAVRTLVQVGIVGGVIALLQAFAFIDWNATQTAAVMGVATPIVVFIQNWLEDNTDTPAILKSPASPGMNPTP